MKSLAELTSILAVSTLLVTTSSTAQERKEHPKTALLLIDIQKFYFPGGKSELVDPEPASLNAKRLLERFRAWHEPVVHIRHNSEPGGEIHENVRPIEGEPVLSKNEVNAFYGTNLLDLLRGLDVERVVIAGMMTHMCVEAATRAAHDYGFECILIQDACATRDLKFGDVTVSAKEVHYSTLATLDRTYARVMDTAEFLAAAGKEP